jgi:hypothetical protein
MVSTTTGNKVMLCATDSSQILANAGSLEAAVTGGENSGGVAIGAAAAFNVIDNSTEANITSSTVNSGGAVTLDARGDAEIYVNALGIAGALGTGEEESLNLSGAGSVALNFITNTISTTISGSTVTSDDLGLQAIDSTSIIGVSGSVGLGINVGEEGGESGSLAVGVSIAVNDAANTIQSSIDQSTASGDDGVTLKAKSNETIEALTVAGTVSADSSAAFAGAGSASEHRERKQCQQ